MTINHIVWPLKHEQCMSQANHIQIGDHSATSMFQFSQITAARIAASQTGHNMLAQLATHPKPPKAISEIELSSDGEQCLVLIKNVLTFIGRTWIHFADMFWREEQKMYINDMFYSGMTQPSALALGW